MADETVPSDLATRIASICRQFEAAWQSGGQPSIEEFLCRVEKVERQALLLELVRLDSAFRLQAGQQPTEAEYIQRFAAYAADTSALFCEPARQDHKHGEVAVPVAEEVDRELAPTEFWHSPRDASAKQQLPRVELSIPTSLESRDDTKEIRPVSAASLADLPDIPGYEVLGLLGRGGMGVVLKARHRVLGRLVAIKLPLTGHFSGADERERFVREARAAAKLHHPHICPIHEVGQIAGRPYLVLHFVAGKTLREWSRERRPAARGSASLLAQVARAVAYAHEHGVVHRDLKPTNVMIDAETNQPMLMDFGLAKELGEEASMLTQSGQVMGTPAYMAPEQAAGRLHDVGPHSDIYALGAILYELVCDRRPFEGGAGEVLKQVLTDEPTPPRRVNRKLHIDLETICLKSLAKIPSDRYTTANALADDLERFAAGEPIVARRRSAAARVWQLGRRRPTLVGMSLALVSLLALAAMLALNAQGNQRAAALNHSLEQGLDATVWTDQHLSKMEAIIAQLERLSPAQAATARERLYRRYDEVQREVLRRAVLSDDDVESVEKALAALQQRAPDLQVALRNAFEERKAAWETVLDLAASKSSDLVFGKGIAELRGRAFFQAGENEPSREEVRLVFTEVPSPGEIELEAVFAPLWRDTNEVGLVLNALSVPKAPPQVSGRRENYFGYTCRLRVAPPASGSPQSATPKSFAQAVVEHHEAVAEIIRDETLLVRTKVDVASIVGGNLRLRAARSGDRLTFQVGSLPSLAFQDVFPLGRAQPGMFALVWPSALPLEELRARRRKVPSNPSQLENGDALFGRGEFLEAVKAYQAEQIASVGTPAAQEARYKEALCLSALERPEARERLQTIQGEQGDRWPVLAGCQLWLLALRSHNLGAADEIFETLASRYRFEQLVSLVPSELRNDILTAYRNQAQGFSYYKRDPLRIIRLRRAVEVEDLLSDVDVGYQNSIRGSRWSLLRSLEEAGQLDEALTLAEQIVAGATPQGVVDDYCWLLSLRGRGQEALEYVGRNLFERPGVYHDDRRWLLLIRSRLLANLGRWDEAAQSIEDYFAPVPSSQEPVYAMACLVRGLLRERRGDAAGAAEAWRAGYTVNGITEMTGSMLVATTILGSWTGDMTDQDAQKFITVMSEQFVAGSEIAAIRAMVTVPPVVLREMWRTTRGREVARKIAFREVPMADFARLPAMVMVTEFLRQHAFAGQWNQEQERIAWDTMQETATQYYAGEIDAVKAGALGLAWKGQIWSWNRVASTLPTDYRARLAYILAHRYLGRQQIDDARALLHTAVDDSSLHALAADELTQLNAAP